MQVDPIKLTLKAPGTKILKLAYDELRSSFAFKFNLRRYNQVYNRRRAKPVHRATRSFDAAAHGKAVQVDGIKTRGESAYDFSDRKESINLSAFNCCFQIQLASLQPC